MGRSAVASRIKARGRAGECYYEGLTMSSQPPPAAILQSPISAYAYAFVALGELPAAIVGWCMTLEYGISGAAVAKSWGEMVRVGESDVGVISLSWLIALYGATWCGVMYVVSCLQAGSEQSPWSR